MTIWQEILEMLKQLWQAFVESGLAEDTAEAIGGIITNISDTLIPLMWKFISVYFGAPT